MLGSIILLAVLIFLNAVFASAEIAVISINEMKLKKMAEQKDKRAIKLTKLTSDSSRFLSTIQIAITLAGLLSSAFAADNFADPLVEWLIGLGITISPSILNTAAVFVITIVLAYFNLVLGELVPKRLAMQKADSMALGMAGMLYGVAKLFSPIVTLLSWSTDLVLKLLGIDPDAEDDKMTEEEILMVLAEGNEQGVIDEHESEIIQNLFEFGDTEAEQICTHRVDVVALDENDSDEEWQEIIYTEKHTYYPIYRDTKDNVTGILDTRDYFRLRDTSRAEIMAQAVRPVYFIPEGLKADTLFQNMRRERKYFAVLLDEYGGMSGIITIHDLLEAIVGDMYDEDETDIPEKIQKISENRWLICGDAELTDLEKTFDIDLPDECETFNGLVCDILGTIPEDGSTPVCEKYGLKIFVQTVERHYVEKSIVEFIPEDEHDDGQKEN
ncbi:MAG: HlyC/CorC family transporter [Lachnospiraceae bacterium]|jgi:putative hemolysin|nr:HlyC/CorC family transporter [Lachnospiraceae bacterium]